MTRNFTHRRATRDKTPLLVGLVGPSSSGKTKSALRLARGFQRVNPGKIFGIDTEAGRMLQYADEYDFEHVPFGAPFGPLDYLDVIKFCIDNGATTVIVDSVSHEHEGPGGILEMHSVEHARLGGKTSTQMLAWNKPKSEHRRMLNTILQFSCNFIFCFRAKEKLKLERGKDPSPLGFVPIGDPTWTFEMTAQFLMMPGSKGVPTFKSEMLGENGAIKIPGFFEDMLAGTPQLSEDIGEAMATWSTGTSTAPVRTAPDLIASYAACSEPSEFRRLEEARKVSWSSIATGDKPSVKAASEQCAKKIEDAAKTPDVTPVADTDEFIETKAS